MASLTCPSCGSILKTKDPVPPGKKVKCPKCGTVFAAPPEEPAEAPPPAPAKEENAFADLGAGQAEEKPKKKVKPSAKTPREVDADGDAAKDTKKTTDGGGKNNKMIISLIVAAVLLFCCCPGICGTIYSIFAGAINAAIGIGAAAQQQKALRELEKAKFNFEDLDKTKKK